MISRNNLRVQYAWRTTNVTDFLTKFLLNDKLFLWKAKNVVNPYELDSSHFTKSNFFGYADKTVSLVSGAAAEDGSRTITITDPVLWVPTGGPGNGTILGWGLGFHQSEVYSWTTLPIPGDLANGWNAFQLSNIRFLVDPQATIVRAFYDYQTF